MSLISQKAEPDALFGIAAETCQSPIVHSTPTDQAGRCSCSGVFGRARAGHYSHPKRADATPQKVSLFEDR